MNAAEKLSSMRDGSNFMLQNAHFLSKVSILSVLFLLMAITPEVRGDQTCYKFRYGNFANHSSITIDLSPKKLTVNSLEVSAYQTTCVETPDSGVASNFTIKVQNRTIPFSIMDLGYKEYLVIIYWDNSFACTVYPDLPISSIDFSTSHPYDENMLWRFVSIPPGSVYDDQVMISNSECLDCGYIGYHPNIFTRFTRGNSLGYKNIMINKTDESGHSILTPISDRLVWKSRAAYTIVYMYNTNQLVMLTDIDSEYYFTPLVMIVVCMIFMFICRHIYKKQKTKMGKSVFRHEKSIRLKRNVDQVKVRRFNFIDTMRGLFLIGLIFFTEGGGNYNFFNESLWVGFTYADLPEYAIAWLMGFCLPFNYRNNHEQQQSKLQSITSSVIYGCMMFAFGFLCNKNHNSAIMVYLGFLQYAGLAFIILSVLYICLPSTTNHEKKRVRRRHFFKQKNVIIKFSIMTGMVLIHTLLILLLNAPGCPRAYFGPGGITNGGKYSNCTGGLYGYIDLQVFTSIHLNQDPACQYLYQCSSFSRYSILGFPTFLYGIFLGLMTGQFFLEVSCYEKRVKFLAMEFVMSLSGGALLGLTSAYMHTAIIPISKPLWSLSFILMANFVICVFALYLYSLEEKYITMGWPFKAIGKNAPLVYILSILLSDRFPFSYQHDGSHLKATVSNLLSTTIWMAVAVQLHKYRFYVRY